MTDPKLPPLEQHANDLLCGFPMAEKQVQQWGKACYRAGQSEEQQALRERGLRYVAAFGHGNAEDMHTERDLNCVACGGSGHVDDVRQSSAEPMTEAQLRALFRWQQDAMLRLANAPRTKPGHYLECSAQIGFECHCEDLRTKFQLFRIARAVKEIK